MRIGELSSRTGVSVRSLRYYEEQGILTSVRSAGGQRHYTEEHVDRVGFIRCLFAAGLSSRAVAELLPCADAPSDRTTGAALERMRNERDRLSDRIGELARARDRLDGLIAANEAYQSRTPSSRSRNSLRSTPPP
ncbi:MerR family transcriptional regulator [Nocardiopsis halophila]|uniref:MerR family transcriptional regulator n=1 Tax=Nocardiopsis halophila TaxID=141692 RepID=UPI000382AA89|nr:MerR family transcriptional regulator [Nocardiopsis halophila]